MPITSLEPYSILIVEDVRTTRIKLLGILKSFGCETIMHADNGHEAISMLQSTATMVDAIIADFNMPIMNGLTMAKLIRTGHEKIRRDLPILMLTGHGDRNLFGLALALDVNAFLLKPAGRDNLFERLARILQFRENWVKPVESYKYIDVTTAVQGLLRKPTIVSESTTNHHDTISKAVENHRAKQDIKIRAKKLLIEEKNRQEDALIDAAPPTSKTPKLTKPKKCYDLDHVKPNSIIAEDIVGYKNKKLLASGVKLTKGMINSLKDLRTIGEPVGQIWIEVE
ncbi:MAG: response regulator [Candidatus Hinthialibacter antarcticus]|nr:response regulator [Candidatus Hinthialibacter antarcticus]